MVAGKKALIFFAKPFFKKNFRINFKTILNPK